MEILGALLEDDGVHGIIFISFATFGANPFRPLVGMIREHLTKPIFFSLLGTKENVEDCRSFLEEHRIPFYPFPEMAVRVFAHMWHYARKVRRP